MVILFCFTLSHGLSVDSVTVDSVWNSDSSWYDGNGIMQQRLARDCLISFVPKNSGYVSCSLKVSLDSGNTWVADPDPLCILGGDYGTPIMSGKKGHIKARLFGGERPNVVFKITANVCTAIDDALITNTPGGSTVIFSDGFGGGLSAWRDTYMPIIGDFYPAMRISTVAAHTGTHSITTDSNRTALIYYVDPRIETGIVGAQFYFMAMAKGQINFTVEIGQNAGSSGGLGKSFGFGFDKSDSVKTTYYDSWNGPQDIMLSAIQLNHWYKGNVEINFADNTVTYYLDDVKVRALALPLQEMYGIDRVLVFRGLKSTEGLKPYFADDIILYTR
jgi:hypothetical protein